MLTRLRHNAVIGRDDEHNDIDAGRTGEHIPHKTLVAGNVDERYAFVSRSQLRKPDIDRDTAAFFIRQTVRVNARQRSHKCCFSVVDMTCGSDDNAHLGCSFFFVFFEPAIECLAADIEKAGRGGFISGRHLKRSLDKFAFDIRQRRGEHERNTRTFTYPL